MPKNQYFYSVTLFMTHIPPGRKDCRQNDPHQFAGVGRTDLYLLRSVMNRLPVWYTSHSRLSVSKLLTEGSILGLRVSAPVGVVEGHVQEKRSVLTSIRNASSSRFRFLFVSLEELPDQKFYPGDVPPHLQH